VHGGNLEAARRAFGGARADWLDLSTGINPHRWPGADTIAIDWSRLPEPDAVTALEAAAAAHFGTDPAYVCALPGSEIGLRLLGDVLPGDAVHVAPGYGTHAEAFAHALAIEVDEIEREARAGSTILLANPNNPDGRRIAPGRLIEIARLLEQRGGWLIVDEAFADTDGETSLAPYVAPDLPLVLFRSFGKFFGLAGVRLGFVIGPEPILAAYREALGAWPVSAAAIAIGTAAYHDRAWIETMRSRLTTDAAALDALLARHAHRPIGTCPLFRLIETPDAPALFEKLTHSAILTRPFAERRDWLRFGLPGDAGAYDRLDRALSRG
jgi:cobalamin biosynthetic protein CobC